MDQRYDDRGGMGNGSMYNQQDPSMDPNYYQPWRNFGQETPLYPTQQMPLQGFAPYAEGQQVQQVQQQQMFANNGYNPYMSQPYYPIPNQQGDPNVQEEDDEEEEEEEETNNNSMSSSANGMDPGILNNFITHTGLFLTAVQSAFYECPKLKAKRTQFDTMIKPYKPMHEQLCKEYHNQMKNYYDACTAKDPTPFLEEKIGILKDIDFKSKFLELTNVTDYTAKQIKDNVDSLWEYIIEMNKYSRLYNQLPQRIVGKVEAMALNIAKQLSTGEKTPKDLNIMKIGKEIVEKANNEELNDLIQNMGSIYQAVGGMEGMKGSMGGKRGPNIPNIGGLAALLQKGGLGMPPPSNLSASIVPPIATPSSTNTVATSVPTSTQTTSAATSSSSTPAPPTQTGAPKKWKPKGM